MKDGLPTATLGELVTLQSSKAFAHKDTNRPYLGLEQLASGEPRILGTLPSAQSVSVNSLFEPNDILFGKLRPNLRKCVSAPFAGYSSTDILVLRAKPGVNPRFAGHIFQSDRVFEAAVRSAMGTKMPRTNWPALQTLRVFAPKREDEQARIAENLEILDAAIRQTEAVVTKLRQVKTGLLHDLLTLGLDEHGQLRDPFRHPEQFRDTPIGAIPREWSVGGFLDVASNQRQAILTGPFGAELGTGDFVKQGTPVLRIGNVQAGWIDLSDLQFIAPAKAQALDRYRVIEGDLLFARQGATTGRNALADRHAEGSIINYHIIRVALDPEKCTPLFIYAALNSDRVMRQVNRDKGRGTREGINSTEIASLRLPLPSPEEQRRIAASIVAFEQKMQAEKSQLSKLHFLKRGLAHDLLTGRVRVKMEG